MVLCNISNLPNDIAGKYGLASTTSCPKRGVHQLPREAIGLTANHLEEGKHQLGSLGELVCITRGSSNYRSLR